MAAPPSPPSGEGIFATPSKSNVPRSGKDDAARRETSRAPRRSRRVVLSCAWKDSLLEQEFKKKGWEVVVISEEDDLTTEFGISKAVTALTGPGDVLWHSQPCTGGCPWQRINLRRNPATRDKVKQHWKLFAKLWKSFEIVANHALSVGASVYNEWPQGCSYWANKKVSTFFQKKNFDFTMVHGCMYGLTAKCGKDKGRPIKKPWK